MGRAPSRAGCGGARAVTCVECDTLRERVRQLEDMLATQEEFAMVMPLLTSQQMSLFRVMMRWPVASVDVLSNVLQRSRELQDPDTHLRVQVHRMRKRLANIGITIETVWGVGYRIPQRGALLSQVAA